jgi:hypothetical protein
MLVYRVVSDQGEMGRYYSGATESSKVARELSKDGDGQSVYEFATPKIIIDKVTFLQALNEEAWCEPKQIAHFVDGRSVKIDE